MSVSTLLEIYQMAAAASEKDVVVNAITAQLENIMAGMLEIDTSGTSPISIPFDDSNDLSDRDALHHMVMRLTAGATSPFELVHPDNQHLFVVHNETTQTATVKTDAGTGVDVASGAVALVYCDGTNVIQVSSGGSSSSSTKVEDYAVHHFGTPAASEIVAKFLVPRSTDFSANFASAVGTVETPPATAWDITIYDDGAAVGTATLETDGSVTFANSGAFTVAAGSILEFRTPATVYACTGVLLNVTGLSTVGTL